MVKTNIRNSLSQKRILQVAVKYADKHGIDSLNMRELAKLLNTGPMSIYHYFSNKEELLDEMVEWVAAKIPKPNPRDPWRKAITDIAIAAHHTLMKHAWVNSIWSTQKLGPNKLMFMESILRVLREGGFSVPLACDAYHAIVIHIEGFTLHAVGFPVKAKDAQSVASAFLESVEEPELIPYFIEHVQHHVGQQSCGDQFGATLDMLLDGFEARFNHS
ncbi:TetR/AcrR family transcriptional regulator [Vibrio tubiashii]|uniref:TetR/AcrR family transcriptional regulator n=1 Tax=Vibrio tubiashii TaxID=29498 RepID=A0AAE5GPZ4_9VIBR|nr:TetR/AcrR family transcriptional regulator [Vibrio tubiashii]NOI80980.1 TetR/AcrR family transcriptional regulator [Vibrio tubiashii]